MLLRQQKPRENKEVRRMGGGKQGASDYSNDFPAGCHYYSTIFLALRDSRIKKLYKVVSCVTQFVKVALESSVF